MGLNKRMLIVTSLILMSLACTLYIVSNALPAWGRINVARLDARFGIWRICVETLIGSQCLAIECDVAESGALSSCSKMIGARAFMTVSCAASAISVVVLVVALLQGANATDGISRFAKSIPFSSFPTGVVGVALGISFVMDNPFTSVSVASILAIIAVITNLIGAIVAFMIPIGY